MTDRHNVAFATDSAYLPWATVAATSFAQHYSGAHLDVHLLVDDGVDERGLERVRSAVDDVSQGRATVVTHDVGTATELEGLPTVGRFGTVVWRRLLLPDLVRDGDRVLYLDADTLTVADPLPLLEADLQGQPIGAVVNVSETSHWDRLTALGLLDPASAFNSGVLLMDLDSIGRDELPGRARDVAAVLSGRVVWPDQEVLNVLFAGRWAQLDVAFNSQASLIEWPTLAATFVTEERRAAAVAKPVIVHFEGPDDCKPWHPLSQHPHADAHRRLATRLGVAGGAATDLTTKAIAALPRRTWRPLHQTIGRARTPKQLARLSLGRLRHTLPGARSTAPDPRTSERVPHPLSSATDAERRIVARVKPYTMTSIERILATVDATNHAVDAGIPGTFVECGVWLGGSTLAMVLTLLDRGVDDRDVFLFDTFEGMTAPSDADTSRFHEPAMEDWERSQRSNHRVYGQLFDESRFSLGIVQRLLLDSGYPEARLHFVVGPVEETIPEHAPDEIAVLRLDTDWYESTMHELRHLYPALADGGALLIDDYGHWDGARAAVDEYFDTEVDVRPFLHRSDYAGRLAIKG